MNRPRRFLAAAIAPAFALGAAAALQTAANPAATAPPPPAAVAATGPIPALVSDPAHSRLEFSGTQAGAPFKAVFKKFTASVGLDPARLATSRIDVQIDLNSLDSQDEERDKTIRSADFFDVARNPGSRYVTHAITKSANGYAATGSLTLHGVTRDVPIEFQYTPAAAGATLTGTSKVKRLDFGVGQGDWKSTEWVGDEVAIQFSLILKPAH
jgi:polyisoprenoid-binding protein YceI